VEPVSGDNLASSVVPRSRLASDRVGEAYGSNHERLAAIEAVYDPANFFRSNQNVTTPAR
jgi:hypothetical protein